MSITTSAAAFSALLAERENNKICCEALTIENQCILGLAADSKELQEKLADLEKAGAASKTAPKIR